MDGIRFIGTATTLIRVGSFTLLTDPNFLHRGQRAYLGKGLWSRRLTEPAMQPAELPQLDAIVLSHLHGHHFDRIARRELDKSVPLVTTEEAAGRLGRFGFDTHGLTTWGVHKLTRDREDLTIEALPGVHARGLLGRLLPSVMGSLLTHRVDGEVRRRIYLSGDTLTGDHLDLIRERHSDIDVAVVHLGGTRVLFHTVTMDGAQGIDFLRRIRPRLAVPVHYDDYKVFKSPLSDFLGKAGELCPVVVPARGETVSLSAAPTKSELTDEPVVRRTAGRGDAHRFGRSPEQLWHELTEPGRVARWLGAIDRSETEYGRLRVRFDGQDEEYEATIVLCDRGVSIDLAWDPPYGRTVVRLAPLPDGTVLTVTQQGRQPVTDWNEPLHRLAAIVEEAEMSDVPSGSESEFATQNGNAGLRPGDPADQVRRDPDRPRKDAGSERDTERDTEETAAELSDRVANGGEPAGDKASSATRDDSVKES